MPKTKRQLNQELDKFLQGHKRLGHRYRDRFHHALHSGSWHGSEIQSLLFDRTQWTAQRAKAWAHEHGYKSGKVHETKNYLRLRQFDPISGTQKRTITFGNGIRAVIEQVP